MVATERRAEKRPASTPTSGPQARKVFHASESRMGGTSKCSLCSGAHPLSKCFKLKDKSPHERFATVKQLHACFNCLGAHRANACSSSGRCSVCQGKHHTLLHLKPQGNSQAGQKIPSGSHGDKASSKPPVVSLHAATISIPERKVILATARVQVIGPNGDSTFVRALLDQGSEISFATESVVQLLGLPKESTCVTLSGLGVSPAGTARSRTQLILRSRLDSNFELRISALVLPRLTSQLPSENITNLNLQQFEGITPADPEFFLSSKVDLILGADVYGQFLRSGEKRFPPSQIVAQNTAFGWIFSGSLQVEASRRAEASVSHASLQALHCASLHELDQTLQRFWMLEDLPSLANKMKPEDETCEQLFRESHSRDPQGRYEVRLPLKPDLPLVAAETRQIALDSLSTMHRRFARDPKLARAYREFMADYER